MKQGSITLRLRRRNSRINGLKGENRSKEGEESSISWLGQRVSCWDGHGLIFIDYLQKMNDEYYANLSLSDEFKSMSLS